MFMLANLEALLELHRQGTMAKASSALRISQSAVSKRISTLEAHYGNRLIEKSGRNVVLTRDGQKLLERVSPLLAELREALKSGGNDTPRKFVIGVSESILSSWGAKTLNGIAVTGGLKIEYHSHRSPLVIEKVESGIYDLGFCSGKIGNPRSVVSEAVAPEEMVLVAKTRKLLPAPGKGAEILSIEKSSATWKAIREEVTGRNFKITAEVESFFSIAQLSKAGFGTGLVPIGVAKALGIKPDCMLSLRPKLFRPVQIVYKKSKLEKPQFPALVEMLKKTASP